MLIYQKRFYFCHKINNLNQPKMKKLSILFISMLTLGLSLTSCSNDDDDKGSIEGKWTPVKFGTIVEGKEYLVAIPNDGKCSEGTIEYGADGKFTDITYEFYDNKCEASTDKGTYTFVDNILSATYDGETEAEKVEVIELTKSSLKVKYIENETTIITLLERR